jgi:hypothetical protein
MELICYLKRVSLNLLPLENTIVLTLRSILLLHLYNLISRHYIYHYCYFLLLLFCSKLTDQMSPLARDVSRWQNRRHMLPDLTSWFRHLYVNIWQEEFLFTLIIADLDFLTCATIHSWCFSHLCMSSCISMYTYWGRTEPATVKQLNINH